MLQALTDGKIVMPLVVPPSWVARLNQLAVQRGINRSALIRAAIAAAYFGDQPEGGDSNKPSSKASQAG
jgi:hypothetical protein